MEFLRIQLAPTDYLAKDWSGSAGVTEIISTDTMIEGGPQGTYVSGYIVSSSDEHGNRFISTDLPEPFRLQGDANMHERVTSIEALTSQNLSPCWLKRMRRVNNRCASGRTLLWLNTSVSKLSQGSNLPRTI